MKFKESGGATAASGTGVDEHAAVSGAAVGPAGPSSDDRRASSARRGDREEPAPASPLSAAAPAGPSSHQAALESLFADLSAASAVLAEHSLSSLLNDAERASVIAARVRVDEVLAALAEAAA